MEVSTKLFVFGHNGYGRLGLGDVGEKRSIPVELDFPCSIRTIACGAGHNLIVTGTNRECDERSEICFRR